MSAPSAFEQLMLEYINQARMDPQGEFERFILSTNPVQAIESKITQALNSWGVDLALYQQQLQSLTAVAPVAWNSALNDAATAHSDLMIAQDAQAHQLVGEASLDTRIEAAGYTGWNRLGENIYAYSESAAYGHAGFFIDWGYGTGGMQSPAGHRNNIMSSNYTEVGIGVVEEHNGATSVGPYVVTQDFGNRFAYKAQIVGVSYDDNDANAFYSIGEGNGGISVAVSAAGGGAAGTTTQAAGGYSIEALAGLNQLTFSGGGLASSVSVQVLFGTQNAKVDLVDGDTILSSMDTTLGNGAVDLRLLGQAALDATGNGLDNTLTGNIGDNILRGLAGHDVVSGGKGDDQLSGNGGRDQLSGGEGDDVLYGGLGADQLDSGSGNDVLRGGKGADTLTGGDGHDQCYGDRWNDSLLGGNGNDTLIGGNGSDALFGGAGADDLAGGPGADTLVGGSGNDTLKGNSGGDLFIFESGSGADVISGFHAGADEIDVLDFSALGISFASLDIQQQGADTLITTPGGDSVLLSDVSPGDLVVADDFLF